MNDSGYKGINIKVTVKAYKHFEIASIQIKMSLRRAVCIGNKYTFTCLSKSCKELAGRN